MKLRNPPVIVIVTVLLVAPIYLMSLHAGSMRHDIANELTNPGVPNNRYVNLATQTRFAGVGFLVSRVTSTSAGPAHTICSGTLISPTTVLTAAHCLFDPTTNTLIPPAQMRFGFGPSVNTPTENFFVFDYTFHPSYVGSFTGITFQNLLGLDETLFSTFIGSNDIALLQIGNPSGPIPTPIVAPIALFGGGPEVGEFAVSVGYGTQGNGQLGYVDNTAGTKLAGINTIDSIDATGTKLNMDFDSPGQLFLEGLPSTFLEYIPGGGDSGGPLLLSDRVTGITSSGGGDGKYGTTATYTRVLPYLAWISANSFGPVTVNTLPGWRPSNPLLPFSQPSANHKLFGFVIPVPFTTVYVDPDSASAFEFVTHSGPSFWAVQLPSGFGDDVYSLALFDSTAQSYKHAATLTAGALHTFGGAGVSRFLITGIEGDASAFVTGLQFTGPGVADFSQIAVTLATVPRVTDLTLSQATNALEAAGLTVGNVTTVTSSTKPAGIVLSQNPAFGDISENGSSVTLIVSSGPAATILGDIDGDGDVDNLDLTVLLQDRGKAVSQSSCGSACDLDKDGQITALDARQLTLRCTRPRCSAR